MNTTPSKVKDNYLPLDVAAAYLHVDPERITRLKELNRLKFYGKKGTEEQFCKLSELRPITHNDIMDAIYGLLGSEEDDESDEGTTLDFEIGGGRW